VARLWGIEAGDSLSLFNASGEPAAFDVKEVFAADAELVSSDLIVLTPDALRQFFSIAPGLFTDIAVTIPNPAEAPNVARKVAERFPGMRPILKSEILRTYRALFDWRSGIVLVLLASAVVAFFIFAWDRASALSQEEKTEIGALKALGWDTSDVLIARTWEGFVISSLAFVTGVLFAWLHVFPFSAALLTPVLKGWSTLFPAFRPVPAIDFFSLAQLFFLTVVPYSVIGIVPAWRIAITDPSEVLQ
jgi:ABC-type lipoprotein release transport system permease subunit